MKLDRSDIVKIISDIDQADADGSQYQQRKVKNFNTRYCIWSGQTDDGRKHQSAYGRRVFPWEGASDSKIFLAESIVRERVISLVSAFFKSRIQVQPVEVMDAPKKAAAETVLKWLLFTHCLDDLRREVRLAAEMRETYGLAIMSIDWERQSRVEIKRFTLEEAMMMIEETQDPNLQALLEVVLDPAQEEVAAELLGQIVPELGKVSKVRELREKGEVEWESPYIFSSKPVVRSLEAWEDIIFPIQTDSIQRAPFIARRELLNEFELRERAAIEGWDKEWVERAIKHKGELKRIHLNIHRSDNFLFEQLRDLVEVWHVYRKEHDDRTGATKVTRTVLSWNITDSYALHELMPYEHAQYPFVELPRERNTRPLLESRGIPEICQTAQEEIKVQRDARVDATSLSIIPPLKIPASRGKIDLVLGPAMQIPERRPNEITWMQPPPFDQRSIEVEAATRADVDRYFGRMTEAVNPNIAMLHMQDLVDSWLLDMKLVVAQILSLSQQYLTLEEISRVTGNGTPIAEGAADIRGKFDIQAEFDARLLDTAALEAKMQFIAQTLVPLDSMQVLDRANLIKFMLGSVDQNLANILVRDIGAASQAEMEDEQSAFAKISAGTEPPLKEGGQNAQIRLQTLQQIIQSNPAVMQRYQSDEIFRRMIDARMKAFNFQLQQQQNAVVGRVGAQPALQQMAQENQIGGPQPAAA
jgi:hypothetical protein